MNTATGQTRLAAEDNMYRTLIISTLTAGALIGCDIKDEPYDTGDTAETAETTGPTLPSEGTWEVAAIATNQVECGIWFVEAPEDMLSHELSLVGETGFSLYDVNGGYDCVIADDDSFTCEGSSDAEYTLDIYGTINSATNLTLSGLLTGSDCVDESDFTFEYAGSCRGALRFSPLPRRP